MAAPKGTNTMAMATNNGITVFAVNTGFIAFNLCCVNEFSFGLLDFSFLSTNSSSS